MRELLQKTRHCVALDDGEVKSLRHLSEEDAHLYLLDAVPLEVPFLSNVAGWKATLVHEVSRYEEFRVRYCVMMRFRTKTYDGVVSKRRRKSFL